MRNLILTVVTLLVPLSAWADEGMWTYDNFPKDQVQAKYGFSPSQDWLKKAMLSSARIAGGCSASFVSGNGLVMTNHHCAHSCIQQLSTQARDYVATGFTAAEQKDEVRCPEIEVNQLTEMQDVTEQVSKATANLEGAARREAFIAVEARLTHACQTQDAIRCDLVTLYHGGKYQLYKYKRFQDVRLVFAPEFAIAFFGGDPDNFTFPRYDLDVSFLRVYENDKPASTPQHFAWSRTGTKEGDLTFVSGHPGATERQQTTAQLAYQRDVALPEALMNASELRGVLTEYQHRGPEQKRHSTSTLFGIENGLKARKGRFEALTDGKLFNEKVAAEAAFRAKVAKDPSLQKKVGGAYEAIAQATELQKTLHRRLAAVRGEPMSASRLFGMARQLVVGTEELTKPNEKRFPEYADAKLPELKQRLFSKAPVYPELEVATLTFGLTKLRESLGPDDAFVRKVLAGQSPEELATKLVQGTKLADIDVRRQLFAKGPAAVKASQDPMLQLLVLMDPDMRSVRKQYESDVEAVISKNTEAIARARFQQEGTRGYPDATFTLRLSYGQVKGYEQNGKHITPVTTFGGAFERHSGRAPFALPATWLAAKSKLNASTPFDVATDNDIIGGNSGSPLFNRDLQVVGLVFDGNIQSLGGDYVYDAPVNRTVAVESVALLEALAHVYGARRLVKELAPELAQF